MAIVSDKWHVMTRQLAGFFADIMLAQRILNLEPSPTLTLDAKVKELQSQGTPIINLTVGEPDFITPSNIRSAAKASIDAGFTHYTPSSGIADLRLAIAKKLRTDNHLDYGPSEIIVGVGAKHILYLAFQALCNPMDEVIVPTPTWSTYVEQIKLTQANPVIVPLSPPFKLTANYLKSYISPHTKAILLNSPSNPTGAVIDPNELEKIAQLAVKHNLYVISDEIYEKLIYNSIPHSIASLNESIKNLTITINGLSKAYAMTGWRVGFAAGPKEVITAIVSLAGQMTSGTSSISQKAALEALQGNQTSVTHMAKEFRKRIDSAYAALSEIKDISVVKPEGAFYLFPNIEKLLGKKYKTAANWSEALLEKAQVAVVPGEAFYAPGYIRLSCAASQPQLLKGIAQIKSFIETNI